MQAKSAHLQTLLHSPVFVVLLFFCVLIVALGASRVAHTQGNASDKQLPLKVETLGDQGVLAPLASEHYIGRVEAGQRVEIGFDVSSRVIAITKREGERFQQGDLLAELDTDRLEARQAELKAQAERADANFKLALSSLQRTEGLKRSGSVSDQALDEARQRRDAAEAEVNVVRAQLNSIDVELERSRLYAPFDGVVIDRLGDVGKTAVVGAPLFLLEQTGNPEIKVSIPLAKAKKLTPGTRVHVRHDEGDFSTRVDRVNLSVAARRVSELYLRPEADAPLLISGEILEIEMGPMQPENGVWLPLSALTEFGRGLWSVYLAEPNVTATTGASDSDSLNKKIAKNTDARITRAVVVLARVSGDKALVSAGLSPSQVPYVVGRATHRIVEGQHVTIDNDHQLSQAH